MYLRKFILEREIAMKKGRKERGKEKKGRKKRWMEKRKKVYWEKEK